jgi:hypothetical protein
VGFNWDLAHGAATQRQIRGGIGLFTGRTPYVWLSNQYGNTGVDLVNLSTGSYSATKSIPFVSDPLNQPTSLTGAGAASQTINVVDPNYQFPSIIRGNLAFDHQLPFFGLVGSAEVLFSDNVNEIKYENLNRIQTSTATVTDARPVFTQKLTTVNDTVLLTNTGEGYSWSVSYKVEKPFRNGFYWSASYLYGDSYSVIDGTSSVAYSNWAGLYTDGDPSNPALRRSDFSPGHRVNMTATIPIPLFKGLRSSASFYYNGQSGRPYSLVFNSDVNNDGRTTNDLLFVPATADQVNVTNGTWAQLDAFLANDPWASQYRGKIGERNGARAPWSNILNFRYAVTVPTGGKTKVEATFDVSNLLNLLNDDWGWVYYPNFGGPTIIAGSPSGGTALSAPAKYTYNLATITAPTFRTFTRDDLRSRWQAQLGARFRF